MVSWFHNSRTAALIVFCPTQLVSDYPSPLDDDVHLDDHDYDDDDDDVHLDDHDYHDDDDDDVHLNKPAHYNVNVIYKCKCK